jgi:predicted nicotinamide N-methyase
MVSASDKVRTRQGEKIAAFIRERLPLAPTSAVPEILIHAAHPTSGLGRLAELSGDERGAPYWAYPWIGGAALARHFFAQPETVRGRRVLDFGAGCGLVGIAAAKCGASKVLAAEIDQAAIVALSLNAVANGVAIELIARDMTAEEPPAVDLIAAGDVFYDSAVAEKAMHFFSRCRTAGVEVIVGDVGRAYLPRDRLRLVAEYPLRDFGESANVGMKSGCVFSFE